MNSSSKKRRTDEVILSKARKHMKIGSESPTNSAEDTSTPHVTDEEVAAIFSSIDKEMTVKKLRKPRHSDKEKSSISDKVTTSNSIPKTISKKKKKKKKRSKSTSDGNKPQEKNIDSVQRHGLEALNFLSKWKHCRGEWKFEKLKQMWLLSNCLIPAQMSESLFEIFLEYVATVQGQARKSIEIKMENLMKEYEASQNPSEQITISYNRARQIRQMLI